MDAKIKRVLCESAKKSGRLFVKMEVSNIIRVARDCLVLQRNSCGPGKVM